MGILDVNTPSPKPVVLNTKQKQQITAQKCKGAAIAMRRAIVAHYAAGYEQIWANPLGLTPQEALDSLGKDAAELLTFAEIIKATVNALSPNSIGLSAPKDVDIKDGKVIVKE